jgi:hypothetical protein
LDYLVLVYEPEQVLELVLVLEILAVVQVSQAHLLPKKLFS